jgi:hypothetical protein
MRSCSSWAVFSRFNLRLSVLRPGTISHGLDIPSAEREDGYLELGEHNCGGNPLIKAVAAFRGKNESLVSKNIG